MNRDSKADLERVDKAEALEAKAKSVLRKIQQHIDDCESRPIGYYYDAYAEAQDIIEGIKDLLGEILPQWPASVECVTCGNEIPKGEALWEDIPYCNQECYDNYIGDLEVSKEVLESGK